MEYFKATLCFGSPVWFVVDVTTTLKMDLWLQQPCVGHARKQTKGPSSEVADRAPGCFIIGAFYCLQSQ